MMATERYSPLNELLAELRAATMLRPPSDDQPTDQPIFEHVRNAYSLALQLSDAQRANAVRLQAVLEPSAERQQKGCEKFGAIPKSPTKELDLYLEAIDQATIAFEALDQAHSRLKDIHLDQYVESGQGPYRLSIRQLVGHAEGFLEELKNAECLDCQDPVLRHTRERGCDVVHADGRCPCQFGAKEIRQ